MKRCILFVIVFGVAGCREAGNRLQQWKHLNSFISSTDAPMKRVKLQSWYHAKLEGDSGTLNYPEVTEFLMLCLDTALQDYSSVYTSTDITGKYYRDRFMADTTGEFFNLCVEDYSQEGRAHIIARIHKKNGYGRMVGMHRYYHGNYPCSWEHGKFDGFFQHGKYYWLNISGTGSGFCDEHRIFLNHSCQPIGTRMIPVYMSNFYEAGFSSFHSNMLFTNDSMLRVDYFMERGSCPDPETVSCEYADMKRKKSHTYLVFTLCKDTILCNDTAELHRIRRFDGFFTD